MTWPLFVAALLSQAPAAPSPAAASNTPALLRNGWAGMTAEQRAALITSEAGRPLPERLVGVSERFLHTPYVVSPLGEGQGVDPDPMFRLDAVDCLTFVEEVLALSMARREDEVAPLLEHIRYGSTPVYEDRNHLMEAQWLPNNVRKGFVVDVTRRYGGEDAVATHKVISAATWQSKSSQELKLPRERQMQGRYALTVLPMERIMAHARQIPSGTILVVVRDDLPLKVTRVTHVGFVMQKGSRTYLRHASRSYMRVVDEDLGTFLSRNEKYSKWRVTGVSLFEARAPSDGAQVLRGPEGG